jgi:hypothetical protein
MKKINICPACEAQKRGVISRIAFVHTCGKFVESGRATGKQEALKNTNDFLEKLKNLEF